MRPPKCRQERSASLIGLHRRRAGDAEAARRRVAEQLRPELAQLPAFMDEADALP
jgi:hypothetical protein